MRPTQSGTVEPTRWRDAQARHVPGYIDHFCLLSLLISDFRFDFGLVPYLGTTAGFVADQLM